MKRLLFVIAAVALAGEAAARERPELPPVSRVGNDPVYTLLAPDAIPSIDEPRFVTAGEATFMRDEEPVIGVASGGVAKAYSAWHLDHHEIVNDVIAGRPLAVTW